MLDGEFFSCMNHLQFDATSNINLTFANMQEAKIVSTQTLHQSDEISQLPGYNDIHRGNVTVDIPSDITRSQNFNNANDGIQVLKQTANKRKLKKVCCGYFPTRCACCGVWISSILVFLGLIAFLVYYYYPQMPTFVIGAPYSPPNSKFIISVPNGDILRAVGNASVANPFSMVIQYAVNITIVSKMRLDIPVSIIDLKVPNYFMQGFFQSPKTKKNIPTFTGFGNVTNILIVGNQVTTFTLVYYP